MITIKATGKKTQGAALVNIGGHFIMNVKLHARQPGLMYYIMRLHNEEQECGRAAAGVLSQ